MKKFWHENSLSIVLLGLFIVFLFGQSLAGYYHENEQLSAHRQATLNYGQYVVSSEFLEAVFENWESEFLQMGALVILTIWLRQKGAADSKKIHGFEKSDIMSRLALIRRLFRRQKRRRFTTWLYRNSLSLVLFAFFIISFVLHAINGTGAANDEALQHGEATRTVWQYMGSSQFWFESLQNWQSEFLAVGSLLILSIHFRQVGSPESKALDDADSKTES